MISIIIPVRNEEQYIEKCLTSVINNDYPKENMEVFVVDGMSEDKTRDKIYPFLKKYKFIHLIENPDKTVPYALNTGIQKAKGDLIIRLDAHAEYPKDYFSSLVSWQKRTNADNVGGVLITKPGNHTPDALAIALATSSFFGVGNAYYRFPKHFSTPKEVDTVPFGCYKKDVFNKIGLFDVELTRNQDDEFNARLRKYGGKIILIPEIKVTYFARDNFRKMFRMFFQYGYYKPVVNKKIGKPTSVRQFAPVIFTLFLFSFPLLIFLKNYFFVYTGILGVYFLLNIFFSLKIAYKEKERKVFFFLVIAFFLIHVSYGFGYLSGLFGKAEKNFHINR